MFKLSEKKYIPLSKVEVQSYIDNKFSTRHIHLNCESNEKCFVVAFKTSIAVKNNLKIERTSARTTWPPGNIVKPDNNALLIYFVKNIS